MRTQGYLYPENGAWIYLGAQSAKGEPWHRYSGRTASVGAPATPDDQKRGFCPASATTACAWKFPARWKKSSYDIIELAR